MASLRVPGRGIGVCAALLFLLSAPSAWAQTRLFLLFAGDTPLCSPSDCEPARVLEIDVDGRRILADTPVLHARESSTPPVVTPDGRYLAWIGTENRMSVPSYLSVFDTAARRQTPLVRTSAGSQAGYLLADRRAVRLFAQFELGSPITIAEPQGFRSLPAPCGSGALRAISGDGARLVVVCQSPLPIEIAVLEAATGVVAGRTPVVGPYAYGTLVASSDDGRALYAGVPTAIGMATLRRIDVATGVTLAERAIGNSYSDIAVDGRTNRLYLVVSDAASGGSVLEVYDSSTLALIRSVPSPVSRPANAVVVPDPERDAAYVVWFQPSTTSTGWRTTIMVLDTAAWTVVAQAELANDTRLVGMVQGPRPPRASGLSASVTGNSVTLGWTNATSRTLATGLVVEAGSASGLSNLAVLPLLPTETALTVPNVPRGSYYVRVRAVNGTGPGEPSNEVLVTVP
jgi:hypothetical protein